MNPQEQALLEQLKDVALPADPGWWPPAIGWWIALLLVLLICAACFWMLNRLLKKRQSNLWRSTALTEHKRISDDYLDNKNQYNTLAELSVLMRRVSLAVESRRSVAALTDDQWLQSLDVIGETTDYSNGAGRLLYRHQYQREKLLDESAMLELFELTKNTIKNAGHHTNHHHSNHGEGGSVAAL